MKEKPFLKLTQLVLSRIGRQLDDSEWPAVDALLAQLVETTDGWTLGAHLLQEDIQLEVIVVFVLVDALLLLC